MTGGIYSNMKFALLFGGGILGTIAGRLLLGQWFNHLSIYSAIWVGMLSLYEMRLIAYKPIAPLAWFFIALAWFMLYLGSATVICARAATGHVLTPQISSKGVTIDKKPALSDSARALRIAVIVLSAVAASSTIAQWVSLINSFGSIRAVIYSANQIYQLRIAYEIWQGIPYMGSVALAACSLSGMYVAMRGRLTIVSVLPLVIVGLNGVAGMGRAGILIGGVLFLSSFVLYPHWKLSKVKVFVVVFFVAILIAASSMFISAHRSLVTTFKSETPAMKTLRTYVPFGPSLYFYLSGPPVVFSEYLKSGGENAFFPGSRTFAPFFNVLSHLGIGGEHSTYGVDYYTPEAMNVGTYLKDIHVDFGAWGILLFPYLLGSICTEIYLMNKKKATMLYVVLLAHLYVIIVLSFDVAATKLGYWMVSLIVSIALSVVLEHSHGHYKPESFSS